jgi:hypothetical protein
MNKSHDEAIAGTDAFRTFAQQFGPDDVYNRIILEELLKVLLGIKEEEKKDGAETK